MTIRTTKDKHRVSARRVIIARNDIPPRLGNSILLFAEDTHQLLHVIHRPPFFLSSSIIFSIRLLRSSSSMMRMFSSFSFFNLW